MVVKFAIEPAALVESSEMSSRDMMDLHRRLIRLWELYGILMDPGKGPNSITSQFDNDAARKVRNLWRAAWTAKRRCRRVRTKEEQHVNWSDINDPLDFAPYEHLIDLALVETVRGVGYLGISDDETDDDNRLYSNFCGEVEATLFRYPEQSRCFASFLKRAQLTVVPANLSRSEIWDTWFKELSQKANEVVIIDRYGFSWNNIEGMCRALQFLTESMVDGVAAIYASDPSTLGSMGASEQAILNRINAVLVAKTHNLRTVTISLVPNHEMTRDRYIRFDECAFLIGHGICETLRNEYLAQNMPCVLDTLPGGIIKTMREEVQRLAGQTLRRFRFQHGSLVEG